MCSTSVSTSTAARGSRPDRLSEVRPQERVQRHTVDQIVAALLLVVPVPLMEEQPVDASALAFLEEAKEKDLAAEHLELARTASRDSPALVERLREVVRRRHVLRQKGRGRKKKKKRKKRRLARSRLLRIAWVYRGYKLLPRSPRLLGTNSTHFLRDGGARAVRTWKPGLSTGHWYLAVTCSVPVTPEEHKKFWSFLGDDYAVFHDPLYLTVTCSEFACGVQGYRFF